MLQLKKKEQIPGTGCLFLSEEQEAHGILAVIYEREDRTRGVRFLNEGDTEEDLRTAIFGPSERDGEMVTVDIGTLPGEDAEIGKFLMRFELTSEDFLEGVSEYFCRPGNRERLTGMIREVAASLKASEI